MFEGNLPINASFLLDDSDDIEEIHFDDYQALLEYIIDDENSKTLVAYEHIMH